MYNEYINDRHHVHMNSTQWLSLTEFVKYLGKEGLCKVEDTPKGWFITYIDRESGTLFKEKQKEKRERAELAEQDRHEKEIQEQIERASKTARREEGDADEERRSLQRDPDTGEKVAFNLGGLGSKDKAAPEKKKAVPSPPSLFAGDAGGREAEGEGPQAKPEAPKGRGAIEALMKEQEKAKERQNRKDYWLTEGIVVKVMSKALKAKGLYKEKGVVRKVVDRYVGEIEMLQDGTVVRVDQEELETVLPKIGGLVKIVNGAYRGCTARLISVNVDKFCAQVEVEKGMFDGRKLDNIEYEDICKIHL